MLVITDASRYHRNFTSVHRHFLSPKHLYFHYANQLTHIHFCYTNDTTIDIFPALTVFFATSSNRKVFLK